MLQDLAGTLVEPSGHMRTTLVLLGFALGACGDNLTAPGEPADVRARVNGDLAHVLGATKAAIDGSLAPAPGGHALALVGAPAPGLPAWEPAAVIAQLDGVFAAGSDGVYSLASLGVPGDVAVTLDGDVARFDVAATASSDAIAFELAPDSLVATIGAARAELDVVTDDHVTLAVTFDGPVDARAGGVRVTSAPSAAPVLVADLDASVPRATAELAVGATTIGAGDLEVAAPAATGKLDVETTGLVLAGVGLGDTSTLVTRGGAPAAIIDVNRDYHRTVNLDVAPTTHDLESIATPELDIAIQYAQPIAPVAVTELFVTGLVQVTASTAAVLTGELAIATDPPSAGVDATTGDCVQRAADGGWEASACR